MKKVTVLLPVYNAEPFLSRSIKSILNQTFTDFDFLIINDGSTDGSLDIIKATSKNSPEFTNKFKYAKISI